MLEHVKEHNGVGARRGYVQLLERPLLELDLEALPAYLHGPLRRLDAVRVPAPRARRVEEEPHIRSDLEQTVASDDVAAHDVQDPVEELAPRLLLAEVVLVHDFRVAFEDLLGGERRL
jgi:hypothetical protein